jgi:hypothetical protein
VVRRLRGRLVPQFEEVATGLEISKSAPGPIGQCRNRIGRQPDHPGYVGGGSSLHHGEPQHVAPTLGELLPAGDVGVRLAGRRGLLFGCRRVALVTVPFLQDRSADGFPNREAGCYCAHVGPKRSGHRPVARADGPDRGQKGLAGGVGRIRTSGDPASRATGTGKVSAPELGHGGWIAVADSENQGDIQPGGFGTLLGRPWLHISHNCHPGCFGFTT